MLSHTTINFTCTPGEATPGDVTVTGAIVAELSVPHCLKLFQSFQSSGVSPECGSHYNLDKQQLGRVLCLLAMIPWVLRVLMWSDNGSPINSGTRPLFGASMFAVRCKVHNALKYWITRCFLSLMRMRFRLYVVEKRC